MPGRIRHLWLGLLIAAGLLPLYLLTYNGIYRVDDEHILGARSQSLALWGRFEAPQVSGNGRVQSLELMGDQATQIEPLQAVLGAGLYRLGLATGGSGRQAQVTLNLYATVLTALVMFFTIDHLGFSRGAAAMTTALFGLGSMAWPYATTYFRDSLAMLMGSVAFLGWALTSGPPSRRDKAIGASLTVAGAIGGLLTKSTMAVLLVALGIGVLGLQFRGEMGSGAIKARGLAALVAFLALCSALLLLPGNGPLARYSLSYYAFVAGHFWASLKDGALLYALGPFISPGRSLFLFSPPLLLLFLLPWSRRRVGWKLALPMATFVIGLAVEQALFYGAAWAGAFGWGLRFMLPALPVLFVLAAPVVESILNSGRRMCAVLLWLVLAGSIIIQLSATLIPWRSVFLAWQAEGLSPYSPQAVWQIRFLAIPDQMLRLLQPGEWDLAWLRVLRMGDFSSVVLPAFCAFAIGLAYLIWRRRRSDERSFHLWTLAVVLVAALSPLVMTQTILRDDPGLAGDRPAYDSWLAWAHLNLESSDRVVVTGYASPLWTYMTNDWDLPIRWYSLSYRAPGSTSVGPEGNGDAAILTDAADGGGRVWLVASLESTPAPDSQPPEWVTLGDPSVAIHGQPAVLIWRMR